MDNVAKETAMTTATITSLWRERVNWNSIPSYMREGVALYIEKGIRPGDFLWCIITNDLKGACAHADDVNRHLLFEYVQWFYSFAPVDSWGSAVRVASWQGHKGLSGMEAAYVDG
jgi:hypothetical protein